MVIKNNSTIKKYINNILKVVPDTYLWIEKMEYKKQINRIKNENLYDKNEKPLIDERPHQPKGNQQILTDSK